MITFVHADNTVLSSAERQKSNLGFFESGALLILTHGFAKKAQKTPQQEIELATKRMEEYLARRRK